VTDFPPPPPATTPQPGPGYGALPPLIEDRSGRRRTWWIVGAVVVLAAAAALGAVLVFGGDDAPPKPIALPSSFSSYALRHDSTAQQLEAGIRTSIKDRKKGAQLLKSVAIGAYARSGASVTDVVVVVWPSSVGAANADDLTRSMLGLSDPNAGYEQIGVHGGSSRCVNTTISGQDVPVCAWRDDHTFGLLVSIGTALGTSHRTPHQLNAVALAFRDVVD